MTKLKRTVLFVLLASLLFGCLASNVYRPRKMVIPGDYTNCKTGLVFPELWNGLQRESITSFNKDSSDIGVTYVGNEAKQKLKITVYVYPASFATEDRIQNEFYNCLKAIAISSKQWVDVTPDHLRVSKDGYQVLGLTASISHENLNTVLVLFECGKFFLKYRISSAEKDTTELNVLAEKLTIKFSPIDIVKKHPLIIKSTLHIAPAIIHDDPCLDAILAAAGAKLKWVYENVDSLEQCSGYPSLYFEEQKIPIDSMLNQWERTKHNNTIDDKYFNDLKVIRDSGFLNEFICEQYGGMLLLPDSIKLKGDSYQKWKKRNHPSVKLVGEYYYYLGLEKSYK